MRPHALIALYVFAGATGQLCLRAGARGAGARLAGDGLSPAGWASVLGDPWVLAGLALWVVSTGAWLVVLSRTELSYAYGLGAASYLLVPLLARALLAEPLPPLRLFGMVLVALGIACVLASRSGPRAA